MSKVEIQVPLDRPLDRAVLERIDAARGIYGILRLEPADGRVVVEYDASRLTEDDVEAALRKAGVPVRRDRPEPA